MYEASSNANISDDYLYGNLWASDGQWPTCTGNSQAPCQDRTGGQRKRGRRTRWIHLHGPLPLGFGGE